MLILLLSQQCEHHWSLAQVSISYIPESTQTSCFLISLLLPDLSAVSTTATYPDTHKQELSKYCRRNATLVRNWIKRTWNPPPKADEENSGCSKFQWGNMKPKEANHRESLTNTALPLSSDMCSKPGFCPACWRNGYLPFQKSFFKSCKKLKDPVDFIGSR